MNVGIQTGNYDLRNDEVRKDFAEILKFNKKAKNKTGIAGFFTVISTALVSTGIGIAVSAEPVDEGPNFDEAAGSLLILMGVTKLFIIAPFFSVAKKHKQRRDELRLKYRM